jgi:hypothetical protein
MAWWRLSVNNWLVRAVAREPACLISKARASQNHGELVIEIVRQPGRQVGDGFHSLRLHDAPLQLPAATDIVQHQDGAQQFIRAVLKTGQLHRGRAARAGRQRVGARWGRASRLAHQEIEDGVGRRRAGGFLVQREHLHEQALMRVLAGPAGEPLGDRVHENHFAVVVGGDDALANASQGGSQPRFAGAEAALYLVLVDGDLHGAAQLGIPYGFQNVPEWLRLGGPVDGLFVSVGGDIDHRCFQFRLHLLGGGDTVDAAFQTDVHEDQIERCRPG